MKKVHFVGIGGAGMAPLAAILHEQGTLVSGSDRELNAKTRKLADAGVTVFAGHHAGQLPSDADLLVYSSAVGPDNPERTAARALGLPELRRGELLAEVSKRYRRVAAVSGSHGKTSITAMLVHILRHCGRQPGFLIGGSVAGLPEGEAGDGDIFVTEADESDGTHTALFPALGIVPNADDDHAWSVGGEAQLRENFVRFARQSAQLLYYRNFVPESWFAGHPAASALDADRLDPETFRPLAGFQMRNAALAVAAAERLGVDRDAALAAVKTFPGVRRRMTERHREARLTIVEDYAHHPVEVANALELLRLRYPGHHLRVVFQPHRYARLQKYLAGFADVLRRADSVIVAPVFAAWTETGPVGGAELAAGIGDSARYLADGWPAIAAAALDYRGDAPLLLAVLGAGDIERIFAALPANASGENPS